MRNLRNAVRVGLASLCLAGAATNALAAFITGPSDPDYNTAYQGASAATFAGLGYSVGTGPGQVHISTGTWSDPAGLVFGTALGSGNLNLSGTTIGFQNYNYFTYGPSAATINARDYTWGQNTGTNTSTNQALDTPWNGSVFDLGGPANQTVVFPIVDHAPLPNEVLEYTVYLTDNPTSTNLADWHLATLSAVYLQGWQADNISLADGFTTVWTLASPSDTFRYVSVQAVGSQAIQPIFGNEDEIDAVAGLTAAGNAVGVPEPESCALLLAGLLGFLVRRRKT